MFNLVFGQAIMTILPLLVVRISVKTVRWVNFLFSNILLVIISIYLYNYNWLYNEIIIFHITSNWSFTFGIDIFGLVYIWLTIFIFSISFLVIWGNTHNSLLLIVLLNIIQLLLICTFLCFDYLSFYILFESILIPMFFIIGIWGSRFEKIKAAYYFFFYTVFGSIFFITGIIYLQIQTGSTCSLHIATHSVLPESYVWLLFFIAFSIKIPIFPFHIWLPEAHVEAPTVGSIILAALLLKLGTFGYLRFMLPVFDWTIVQYYWPIIILLAGSSIIFASLTAIRQVDIKRIIAYSSIAHMNLAVIGFFGYNYNALNGALSLTIGHGFVSAAMFLIIGTLYDRYHSRLIFHYSGIAQVSPIFAIIVILFSLANIGFPLSYNFIGESNIILGLITQNLLASWIGLIGILLSIIYTMWFVNRLLFGSISTTFINQFYDLSIREYVCFIFLLFPTIILGIEPNIAEGLWSSELFLLSL